VFADDRTQCPGREACASVCERVIDFGGPQESSQTTETSLSDNLPPPAVAQRDAPIVAQLVPDGLRVRESDDAQIYSSLLFFFFSDTFFSNIKIYVSHLTFIRKNQTAIYKEESTKSISELKKIVSST